MKANDWEANNFNPAYDTEADVNNPETDTTADDIQTNIQVKVTKLPDVFGKTEDN